MQNTGLAAIGPDGGGLGYGGTSGGIPNSVARKFDMFNNSGEGTDSTGIFTNGANPTVPSVDMTASGVDLKSTHVMKVHMVYDGTTLTMTITDATTNAAFTTSWPINIATTVGASTAYARLYRRHPAATPRFKTFCPGRCRPPPRRRRSPMKR